MKVGSLFSGIGGFDLGLERAGFDIAWQVEIDEYCRQVLKKHWPAVPCHYDIRSIDWEFIQPVDLVCGGFPCQPFSLSGKRQGKADDRYLWPEVVRCLAVLRPTWFLGENVFGLLHLGIDQVLADLEALGYQVAVLGIPACAVDAPHIRQRVWIIGYADRNRQSAMPQHAALAELRGVMAYTERHEREPDDSPCDGDGPDGDAPGEEGADWARGCSEAVVDAIKQQRDWGSHWSSWWAREPLEAVQNARRGRGEKDGLSIPESLLGRVAHGVSHRVDRLRGLGNAVVPQIAEALGRMIKEASCLTLTGRMW